MAGTDWDSIDDALDRQRTLRPRYFENYLGFYSSVLGGYFREPWAMTIPMDEHGFHRGDGVFEAARIQDYAYIDLDAHLRRLENSATAIGIRLPKSIADIKKVCLGLAKRVNAESAALRLYVTRGPGGFSPSPSEVTGPQLYAALTKLKLPEDKMYVDGVRAMVSTVPAKEAFWAQIKSCNYLQNVLMKKECVDKGFDFAVSIDGQGRVCEGATENILLFTARKEIVIPSFDYTLRGTTALEVMRIAEEIVKKGEAITVRLGDVHKEDLFAAQELAFVGTTLGVLPVSSLDNKPIGSGKAGPIATYLHQRLMERMNSAAELRTSF